MMYYGTKIENLQTDNPIAIICLTYYLSVVLDVLMSTVLTLTAVVARQAVMLFIFCWGVRRKE